MQFTKLYVQGHKYNKHIHTTSNYNFKKIKKVTTKSKAERARLFNHEDGIRNRVPQKWAVNKNE